MVESNDSSFLETSDRTTQMRGRSGILAPSLSFVLLSPAYILLFVPCLIPKVRPVASTNRAEIRPGVLLHRQDPLRHQFLPILLSFRTSHQPIVRSQDHLEKFGGKVRESGVLTCVTHNLGNPLALLRPNVGGRRNHMCRIDQEEGKDLAVTRFCRILQAEGLDPMLVQVRERDASVGFRDHIADILHTRAVPDTSDTQITG